MISNIFIGIFLAVALPTLSLADTIAAKEKKAIIAAEQWLAIVDTGNYATSWQEASEYFRTAVTPQQCEQSFRSVRKPLGKLMARKFKTAKYLTSLPGAPDGEYVVIQFTSAFEKKRSAIETVTPVLESDGKWRVSGYYIK